MVGKELLGKVKNVWEGLVLLVGDLTVNRGWILFWILRALDLAKCIKDLVKKGVFYEVKYII